MWIEAVIDVQHKGCFTRARSQAPEAAIESGAAQYEPLAGRANQGRSTHLVVVVCHWTILERSSSEAVGALKSRNQRSKYTAGESQNTQVNGKIRLDLKSALSASNESASPS